MDLCETEGYKNHLSNSVYNFACFRLLKTLTFSMIVLSPSIFPMTFPVSPHSEKFIRSFECCGKRWFSVALSIFRSKSTVLHSRNSVRPVNVFYSADNPISLQFPLVSCNPFKGTVLILVACSIPFYFSTLSLFCSFRFVIHCAGTLFFKNLDFRKIFYKATCNFFQTSLHYRICVDVYF